MKNKNKLTSVGNLCINVGSGDWGKDGWINLDYPSEWYFSKQKKHSIMAYDMRNDSIPFNNNTVDCIYCSHVIEHIEDQFVYKAFEEFYRVLKHQGVVRIACPDAEFIYNITKFNNSYWEWRKKWFKKFIKTDLVIRQVDFLVREIATPRLRNYGHMQKVEDYQTFYDQLSMYDFFNYITNDLKFDVQHLGDHINYWTYDKIKNGLSKAGFKIIINSKYLGSCFSEMRDKNYFDLTKPQMSLYVEAMK